MADLIARAISGADRGGPVASPPNPNRAAQEVRAGASSRIQGVRQQMGLSGQEESASYQQTVSGESVTAVEQSINLNLMHKTFYFDLSVLETFSNSPDHLLSPGEALQPHRSYRVRVTATTNRYEGTEGRAYPLTQSEVRIRVDLNLMLSPYGDPAAVSALQFDALSPGRFTRETDETWSHDFPFTTGAELPGGSVELLLNYIEVDYQRLPREASKLRVNLAQTGPPQLPAQVQPLLAGFSPPPRTAILHVQSEPGRQISFRGWVRERPNRSVRLDPVASPALPRSEIIDPGSYLRELHRTLSDFAMTDKAGLATWLNELAESYAGDFNMWIVDESESQQPWEMLRLKNGQYLGTVASIVRLAEVNYYGELIALLTPVKLEGRLAAFVDPSDQPFIYQETPLLKQLAPNWPAAPDGLLFDLLTTSPQPVGLAYLSHSGLVLVEGAPSSDLQLLPSQAQAGIHPPVKMDFSQLIIQVQPRPLLFVNAPYSGWMFEHPMGGSCLVCSALAQTASGFLGLLGPVDRADAARFAQRLLVEAASTEGVAPAKLLRELRLQAYQDVERALELFRNHQIDLDAYQAEFERMLSTFMYVYYGSPSTTVRLRVP